MTVGPEKTSQCGTSIVAAETIDSERCEVWTPEHKFYDGTARID